MIFDEGVCIEQTIVMFLSYIYLFKVLIKFYDVEESRPEVGSSKIKTSGS